MYGFNGIVLSRKGFDSSAGGGYSPFDPNKGRKYIWLPIPEKESIATGISNELKFEDITIEDNYLPGYGATNLRELLERFAEGRENREVRSEIGKWPPTLPKGEKEKIDCKHAHLDPWLKNCPWLKKESKHSLGAFGQQDQAQSSLEKQKVGKDTLFLFFSRFVPVPKRKKSNPKIDIENKYTRNHLNGGLYFIYGWFKVGEIIHSFEEIKEKIPNPKLSEELREQHPHATEDYFEKCKYKNNTIYIADELLLPDDTILGCGYFRTLSDKRLLTATDSDQEEMSWMASRWKLPPGLSRERCYPDSPFEKANWVWAKDETPLVETVIKKYRHWQEASFEETEEFCDWLKELLPEMRP